MAFFFVICLISVLQKIKYDPLVIRFILDTVSGVNSSQNGGGVVAKGPDEDKIKEILNRTGYKLDVTTGQRKYGGPPPNWDGDPPSSGCEVSYQIFFFLNFDNYRPCLKMGRFHIVKAMIS